MVFRLLHMKPNETLCAKENIPRFRLEFLRDHVTSCFRSAEEKTTARNNIAVLRFTAIARRGRATSLCFASTKIRENATFIRRSFYTYLHIYVRFVFVPLSSHIPSSTIGPYNCIDATESLDVLRSFVLPR